MRIDLNEKQTKELFNVFETLSNYFITKGGVTTNVFLSFEPNNPIYIYFKNNISLLKYKTNISGFDITSPVIFCVNFYQIKGINTSNFNSAKISFVIDNTKKFVTITVDNTTITLSDEVSDVSASLIQNINNDIVSIPSRFKPDETLNLKDIYFRNKNAIDNLISSYSVFSEYTDFENGVVFGKKDVYVPCTPFYVYRLSSSQLENLLSDIVQANDCFLSYIEFFEYYIKYNDFIFSFNKPFTAKLNDAFLFIDVEDVFTYIKNVSSTISTAGINRKNVVNIFPEIDKETITVFSVEDKEVDQFYSALNKFINLINKTGADCSFISFVFNPNSITLSTYSSAKKLNSSVQDINTTISVKYKNKLPEFVEKNENTVLLSFEVLKSIFTKMNYTDILSIDWKIHKVKQITQIVFSSKEKSEIIYISHGTKN